MTTLLAWAGVDSRGPSSLYLASDSRLSWPDRATWDYGRKLFASSTEADIFGYCGEAFFPMQALSQVVDLINFGVLVAEQPDRKCETVRELLHASIINYPSGYCAAFSVLYGTRCGTSTKSTFHLFHLKFNGSTFDETTHLSMPEYSSHIVTLGSGKETLDNSLLRWSKSDWGRTSRGMFAAFSDALSSNVDPLSGGSPQLVSLQRSGPAKTFGICYHGQLSICGVTPQDTSTLSAISWYNEHLERFDGLVLAPGAKPHPRPSNVSGGDGASA